MTSNSEGNLNPVPSSVIIVNESTPLISQDQQLAGGHLHMDTAFSLSRCLSLSSEEPVREKQVVGLALLVSSSFLFTGVSIMVKVLDKLGYPSFQIVLARACVQLSLGLIGCLVSRVHPLGEKGVRKWILVRALFSSIALILFFSSLTQLTLIEATAPIFKVIIGSVVLSEGFSTLEAVYSIMSCVGVVLIARSSPSPISVDEDEYQRSFAIACALAASLLSAMAYTTVKKLNQSVHLLVHCVYFGCVTLGLCMPVMVFGLQDFKLPHQIKNYDLGIMMALGSLAFLGQYAINTGLRMSPSGPTTVIRMTDIVFAFLFGIALFKEVPSLSTIFGTLLIICMTTCINMYGWHLQELKIAEIRRRKSRERLVQQQQRN
ncbi:Solute carrier family 35 member G1 [Choanephora cucurbitarum]|uniref:Solute carrier family 35 member G1 n=1 Tax=Choanephora cucurbitarum TaxID=101091 RepID=A0A1C7N3A4_9FUNG|nr:Solute carrier family 35 member G1 [Choanephora cucurbitarum]